MSDIYVFGSREETNDYSTMGLVGALVPTKCVFNETANGESILSMEHPLDDFGRYMALVRGNILVAPVPVRTTPEIQNGVVVSTVYTYKVKNLNLLTSKDQRTLYKKATGTGKIKVMNAGDIITVVEKPTKKPDDNDEPRWKVKTKYGTGYIQSGDVQPSAIELVTEHPLPANNSEAISEESTNWKVVNQLFRIYEVKKKLDGIEVSARHISYDLLYNFCNIDDPTSHTLVDTLDLIKKQLYEDTEFEFITNIANEQVGFKYEHTNPIEIFLNEENGICKRFDVGLVRDNYGLYFLHDPGVNRGVRIQYSKNMTGIDYTESDDNVATRIVPIGENKDGSPLYLVDSFTPPAISYSKELKKNATGGTVKAFQKALAALGYSVSVNSKLDSKTQTALKAFQTSNNLTANGNWNRDTYDAMLIAISSLDRWGNKKPFVDSPIIDQYPVVHIKELKCENCKVTESDTNGGKVTVEVARARMEEQARAQFAAEVDKPEISIEVEFVNLGDTEEYRQFEGLEDCFLFDYVIIQNGRLGIDVTAQITQIEWDVLLERMEKVTVGTPGKTLANTGITTWQIPSGFSGSKIATGTVNGGALMDDIIDARHVQAESINTEALQAESVTADKIAANAITADKIAAGEITADKIAAGAISADKIAADTITAEKLNADTVRAYILNALQAKIQSLEVDDLSVDNLASALANFQVLVAGNAEFDQATADHLLANTLQVDHEQVTGKSVIRNLAVLYAQLVSAVVGSLTIKASDGQYYRLDIDASGNLSPTLVTVSEGEVAAGVTEDGSRSIIETTMTVDDLTAGTMDALHAVIGSLVAAQIDVDQLFAREAFISKLTADIIFNERELRLLVGREPNTKIFRQDAQPTIADNPTFGDIWADTSDEPIRVFQAVGEGVDVRFGLDENGILGYELYGVETDGDLRIVEDDLESEGLSIYIAPNGAPETMPVWEEVSDSALISSIIMLEASIETKVGRSEFTELSTRMETAEQTIRPDSIHQMVRETVIYENDEDESDTKLVSDIYSDIQQTKEDLKISFTNIDKANQDVKTMIRLSGDGVSVGKIDADPLVPANDVYIKPGAVDIRVRTQTVSRFTRDYIRLGNMRIKVDATGLGISVDRTAM